jgi:protein-S-isoprenylcysteine O-methyltransferase Ste14
VDVRFPIPLFTLLAALVAHRFFAHRPGDLRGGAGTRTWTTWVVIANHLLMTFSCAARASFSKLTVPLPSFVAGAVLMIAAIGVVTAARRALGRHFSIYIVADAQHELITEGPYRRVRHPIYTGDLLFHVAAPLLTGAYWALPFALTYFAFIRLRMEAEERLLAERYPRYAAYVTETSRLLPGVY